LVAGLFALLGLNIVVQLPFLKKRAYARFMKEDTKYYAQLAHACDLVKQQHPAGIDPWRELPGRESTLPEIILDLHADNVRVYPNRVWIGIGNDADSFAVLWEPDEAQTNTWLLMSDAHGVLTRLYSEVKR
jgi:hypothetical protein